MVVVNLAVYRLFLRLLLRGFGRLPLVQHPHLAQARGFAAAPAQVIQLRAADVCMPRHFNLLEARRLKQEGTFDANPVRCDAANGKTRVRAPLALAHHSSLKDLDALAVAFDDAHVHFDAVAGPEFRNFRFRFALAECGC